MYIKVLSLSSHICCKQYKNNPPVFLPEKAFDVAELVGYIAAMLSFILSKFCCLIHIKEKFDCNAV